MDSLIALASQYVSEKMLRNYRSTTGWIKRRRKERSSWLCWYLNLFRSHDLLYVLTVLTESLYFFHGQFDVSCVWHNPTTAIVSTVRSLLQRLCFNNLEVVLVPRGKLIRGWLLGTRYADVDFLPFADVILPPASLAHLFCRPNTAIPKERMTQTSRDFHGLPTRLFYSTLDNQQANRKNVGFMLLTEIDDLTSHSEDRSSNS